MFHTRKFVQIVLSTIMILSMTFSLTQPESASAQGGDGLLTNTIQASAPDCPPYDPTFLEDRSFLQSIPPECAKAYKKLTRNADIMVGRQDVLPMAVGGPDPFGYSYNDSVSYSWISASTNSGLIGDDEYSGPINIGFNFPFYGVTQSQLYVSTNGLITFGAGSREFYNEDIPNGLSPNNVIAPFWSDLTVGSPDNAGAIYYSQGGSAPNRYFVVEWRNVTKRSDASSVFSFETILYENGDIVVQHQSLPYSYYPTIGIENSNGEQGLQYGSSLSAPKSIRFYYPTTSTARLFVSPILQGAFAPISGYKDFTVTIANSGSMGTDTYDLTTSSPWPLTLYASNAVTALTDTDADSVIDTGPIAQGTSINIIARFSTPSGAQVGDDNTGTITVTSSLDVSKTRTICLFMSIPAGFASVFQDQADGAMSFMTVNSTGTSTYQATADNYFGDNVAVTELAGGNYLYAWNNTYFNGSSSVTDLEYALIGHDGSVLLPATKLTNNSSATIQTRDYYPSIAVAPNGTIGVTWYQYLYTGSPSFQGNTNIYFATLNGSGNLLAGPTNITNNSTWSSSGTLNNLRFSHPTLAASDDNRFIIGWEETRYMGSGSWQHNIWYAIRNTTGTSIFPPTALTSDHVSRDPVLNSLTGGKAILTWLLTDDTGPYYAVINSDGTIFKSVTCLLNCESNYIYSSPDAVQLPNGKVAIAWPTQTGARFVILNSSYNAQAGSGANTLTGSAGDVLSVTTDASSHVIMTWETGGYQSLYYALADSTGIFLSPPMPYKTGANIIDPSWNGQGNAPFSSAALPTVSISGNAGAAGATLSYTDGTPKTATSLGNGSYSLPVSNNWSGTVTPSHTCFTFSPTSPNYSNVTTNQTAENYTATFIPASGCANIDVLIGGANQGKFGIPAGASARAGFAGVDSGPVQVVSTNALPIVSGLRELWIQGGLATSSFQMMGLPASQLSDTYWFPSYNNVTLNGQLRFGNVGASNTTVTVTIGGVVKGTYPLTPNQQVRVSYAGLDSGPVKVQSSGSVPIIAALRDALFVNGVVESFAQTMGLPGAQLSTTYWFPSYNNVTLDEQLRFGAP